MIDIKALFLGPKAENQELYESLIVEIVRDSCFLRKNFHPEDDSIISETDKLKDDYNDTVAQLKQHLQNVLAELKKGVPLYHPRYIGHMHGDLLLSGVAAYFGTMLYNSNNVVGEASPATTMMELKYINALCKMVGYKSCDKLTGSNSWGHLCAGGTTANIEALWIARNIKYYPLSVKIAYIMLPECKFLGDIFINFLNNDIKSLSFNALFNIPVAEILELKDEIYNQGRKNISELSIKNKIDQYSVSNLGVYGIHHKIESFETENRENLQLPKVYIAKSSHYSWDKALDIIGIGRNQLIKIDIDKGFRLNMEDLNNKFQDSKSPTLAVIGILGSSKQGSIDPIDEIIEFRHKNEIEKHSFVIHIDGAYGGYLPSVFWENPKSAHISPDNDILDYLKKGNGLYRINGRSTIDNKWCKKINAISKSDSITIDPHKMGYIPYPAGSILFADTRMKDFISYEPSYLNKPEDNDDLHTAFLGQWTLEGSRPGAAASACYLSNKILSFTQEGYGQLVKNSMHTADNFWNSIETFNNDDDINKNFKIVPLYIPETNIISYVLAAPGVIIKTKYLNMLNNLLYEKFSIKGESIIPAQNFIIAKDGFAYDDIPKNSLLNACGIDESDDENTKDKITILSSVFMNPLSIYLDGAYYMDFLREMVKTGQDIKANIMLDILCNKYLGERIKVLWVEDDNDLKSLKKDMLNDSAVGKCLEINFVNNSTDAKVMINDKKWDIYIIDLNLRSKHDLNSKAFNQNDIDDINHSIDLIKSISEENKDKILIYSSYLHYLVTKEQYIIPLLLPAFCESYKLENHLIPKSGDYSIDKQKIINGIFSVIQK